MLFMNASEGRLAAWAGAAGIVVGAALVGAVARVHLPRAAGPAPAELAELAPDPAALHYRYAIRASSDAAIGAADTIAALEARIQRLASPFDCAELADLYLRRAQQDGDPGD
jgi:hypothetical protein